MKIYSPVYLQKLRKACDKYHVHLIADEIAVGYGRTGKMFACNHANISPDIMCLSKGLTGGYLPTALAVTTPLESTVATFVLLDFHVTVPARLVVTLRVVDVLS